ncbi:MAG: double-strand break repair helicase AddA [Pseudomonadota bacterium]
MSVDDATRAQRRAANPNRSTWLVANAGSGKTRVLTERVARLLLAGVEPQRILCLTYTKAAASEMQNRLFATLGAWTMLPDGKLAEALAGLGDAGPFPKDILVRARTLFARAIETPGGLKIQTIHSFCSMILRRFPLEAGVSPDFREMDERLATLMQREVLEELAVAGDAGLAAMAQHATGDDLAAWLGQVVRQKQSLNQPKSALEISQRFGVPQGYNLSDFYSEYLRTDDQETINAVSAKLLGRGRNDNGLAVRLGGVQLASQTMEALKLLEDALVYGEGTNNPFTSKSSGAPTKAGKEILGEDLTAALHDLMDRMADGLPVRRGLAAADRTAALHLFAASFLPAYEAKKEAGGWLDFDDLINRTRRLLQDSPTANWVLYKLDGGIDHILVDEAQDTSPEQWDVIRTLSQEFLSGQGARDDVDRTIFVVGDKKQSIYSFQGADPRAFDDMRAHFAEMLEDAPEPLQDASLEYSFRSSPAILGVVDTVFTQSGHAGLGQESLHRAFKSELPGRVDVLDPWPSVKTEKGLWYEAVDRLAEADHRRLLAEDIAERVAAMIGTAQIPVVNRHGRQDRMVEPKDILILVQRRSEVFDEIIRACKARGVPMAGADQLNVAQELAVRDITAVLSFLALPEDNLSLATALKSPFFGWSEAQLFDLAHHRPGQYLWPELRRRQADFPGTVAVLRDLLDKADFLRPFELIERLLTWHGGRRAIHARLGPEAEDAVSALLSQALIYEQSETPSLVGFLTWLAADDLKIKRAIDGAANVVRVMTVHGAKGLESPIVIMPDTAKRRAPKTNEIAMEEDLVVWRMNKADSPPDRLMLRKDESAVREEEWQRLLYVAMTRAECWLIVAAAGDLGKDGSEGWHGQISAALAEFETVDIPGGRRYEPLPWPADLPRQSPDDTADKHPLTLPPLPARPVATTMAPSDLGGAKTLPGTSEDEDALTRGTAIHALLEHLPNTPQEAWGDLAATISGDLDPAEILTEARKTLDAHDHTIFGPESIAEAPITADLADIGGQRVTGTIDRLIVTDDRVLAVDFKSNRIGARTPEEVPEGILRQMGAYAAALSQIYPDKTVETAILWTNGGQLLHLPHRTVMDALQRAAKA